MQTTVTYHIEWDKTIHMEEYWHKGARKSDSKQQSTWLSKNRLFDHDVRSMELRTWLTKILTYFKGIDIFTT